MKPKRKKIKHAETLWAAIYTGPYATSFFSTSTGIHELKAYAERALVKSMAVSSLPAARARGYRIVKVKIETV